MQLVRLEKHHLEYANELRNKYIDFIRQPYPHNLEDQIKWYEKTNDIYWIIEDDIMCAEAEERSYDHYMFGIIGLTNIDLLHRKAELSLITEGYLIKQYADFAMDEVEQYAFEKLNLNKLFLTVFEWDIKKMKYFSDRYTKECFLREDVMHKGKFYNHYYFSKLAKEYFK